MRLRSLVVEQFRAPLKIRFTHASADRDAGESLVVAVRTESGAVGYGEGCPRPYVTGETLHGAIDFARRTGPELADKVRGVAELRAWVMREAVLIDANPAAFCALEMALIDVMAREAARSAESLLDLPDLAGTFRYSAVLGDAEPQAFGNLFRRYWAAGFRDYKIKLSGDLDRDRAKFAVLPEGNMRIRADANNLWRRSDDCIRFVRALGRPLLALEEPLAAGNFGGMLEISKALETRIVLDESLRSVSDIRRLAQTPHRWLLNCRVSRLGGVVRSLATIDEARRTGLQVVVGAHVGETSLLTRAALPVARAAGPALIAQEGAFGTRLLVADPCRPIIMFGRDGELEPPASLLAPHLGWGVDMRRNESPAVTSR